VELQSRRERNLAGWHEQVRNVAQEARRLNVRGHLCTPVYDGLIQIAGCEAHISEIAAIERELTELVARREVLLDTVNEEIVRAALAVGFADGRAEAAGE